MFTRSFAPRRVKIRPQSSTCASGSTCDSEFNSSVFSVRSGQSLGIRNCWFSFPYCITSRPARNREALREYLYLRKGNIRKGNIWQGFSSGLWVGSLRGADVCRSTAKGAMARDDLINICVAYLKLFHRQNYDSPLPLQIPCSRTIKNKLWGGKRMESLSNAWLIFIDTN